MHIKTTHKAQNGSTQSKSLIKLQPSSMRGSIRVVIDEPDAYELENEELGIGIFEPGMNLEREMDWNHLSRVLLVVAGGWLLMFIIEVIMMVPVILYLGVLAILYNPWVLIYLSLAEIGFIIPVVSYVRNRGMKLKSVGIKYMTSIKNIVFGIVIGFAMLGANLVISYLMTFLLPGISGDESVFVPPQGNMLGLWLALWTIVMFVAVAFSEELIFRGFLQRRVEMYYREKGSRHYKLVALVLTSALFAAIHLDIFGLATRFVLGLFLGYIAQKQNYSIIGSTVAHGINNSVVIILAVLGF